MRIKIDLTRHKKIVDIAFIVCFLLILVVPVAMMNREREQVSEIDNRKLTEFPAIEFDADFKKRVEAYLLDRIGGRVGMISAYQKICDLVFMKLVHPIYMYGEKGHIFFNGQYIDDYQHLNIDKTYIGRCGNYLVRLYQYLESRNIKFIYFLVPDKKSVYGEFFPSSIHVNGDQSQAMMLVDELKRKGIPFIHPIKEFLKAKRRQQIYNTKYDAGHWNEHGEFIGHSLITRKLKRYFPNVKLLSKSDFDITMTKETSLLVSRFKIDEDVPHYALKSRKAEGDGSYNALFKLDERQFYLFQNMSAVGKPKIMVIRDSSFRDIDRFYGNNFSEVISIHSFDNLKNIEYFINIFEPDVVLLENVERVISADHYLLSVENMKKTVLHDYLDLGLSIAANMTKIVIDPEENVIAVPAGEILSTITGTAAFLPDARPGKTLFAKVNGKYYAAKYPSAEVRGKTAFSLTLKANTLRKAKKIEFILISANGRSRSQSVVFPIVNK